MQIVAAFYIFNRIADPAALREPLLALCRSQAIKGSILLAPEGINGTIAGLRANLDAVLSHLRAVPGCAGLEWKEAEARIAPFARMKVRLKREIVTMGQPDVDPASGTGTYVAPSDWNALISAPDVVVIDTRNTYETAIGSFAGAVDPKTGSFSEFPAWWQANSQAFAGKRIAMYCTGGIRCEKSTNYLLGQGVSEVYHLRGGILKYLQEVPPPQSLWQGECYVFDGRVSVGHGLLQGDHIPCHACGRPVNRADTRHPSYERGVSCPQCAGEYNETDRARFRMRQRQIDRGAEG